MKMGLKSGIGVACLLLAGCATDSNTPKAIEKTGKPAQTAPQAENATPDATKIAGENFSHLIGSKRTDIIKQLGRPNMTMDVTLAGRPPSEGYLYYPKNGKGCIHTFVIIEKTDEVIDYFCR